MMWIFFTDEDPVVAAQSLCDGHLMCPDERLLYILAGSSTLSGHPLSAWVRESPANWQWLLHHLIAKQAEHEWRGLDTTAPAFEYLVKFNAVVPRLCRATPATVTAPLLVGERTGFPRIMPKGYRWPDSCVEAWRLFYFNENQSGEWSRRTPPQWFVRF